MKFETYVYKIVIDHQPNFYKDPCKDASAPVLNARTRDEMCTHAFATRVHASLHGSLLVVSYYLMSLSFKFHKDPIFLWGEIALFVTLYNRRGNTGVAE